MKLPRPTHPYIPIGRGFLYLVAVIDWASRAVLSWRLSNTMDASFCFVALEEALARYGKPNGRLARRGPDRPWTCGQRSRVDHMSTGGTESTAHRTLGGLIKDNQQTAFQLNHRQKRSRCAGPLHKRMRGQLSARLN